MKRRKDDVRARLECAKIDPSSRSQAARRRAMWTWFVRTKYYRSDEPQINQEQENITVETELDLCQAEDIEVENIDSMMSDLTIGETKKRVLLPKFVGTFGKTFKTAAKKLTDRVRDKFNRTKEENKSDRNDNQEEPQDTRQLKHLSTSFIVNVF